MFTGIIEDIGRVKSVEKKGASGRITVEASMSLEGVRPGYSIAVNGACLTVTTVSRRVFTADMSAETLRLTTLGALKGKDRVNLELPLQLNRPLGGHLVTGHVDAVGTIRRLSENDGYVDLEVGVSASLMAQIAVKGSIAVDGISLTVTGTGEDSFSVALIPHTLKNTTLLEKSAGSSVNIETDILAKYVERALAGRRDGKKGVSMDFLSEHGFLGKG